MPRWSVRAAAAGVLGLLCAAYGNHFHNGFHFDDSHAIVQNSFVRDLKFIPRYFVDATTFSDLPLNQSYRPVLQTTLAIDYRLGRGYNPVAFHIDTFVWYLTQLALMYALFVTVGERTAPKDAANKWIALIAVAVYGLHPVAAETVNYVIQRGEILAAVGALAGLVVYARAPRLRRMGLYLLPVAIGGLAKPTIFVFPLLLLLYLRLFEQEGPRRRLTDALQAIAPSFAVVVVVAVWSQNRTPPTWTAGGTSTSLYILTQPWVSLRYMAAFGAPLYLSADNDWKLVDGVADVRVIVGVVFLATVVWLAIGATRRRSTYPVAFGLWWFLIALVPTAVLPLAEVANDHRMFLPFVGLTLAITWAAALHVRHIANTAARRLAVAAVVVGIFALEAVGVRARNEVWRTDDTLWLDVTEKSPTNGRGLMNYGLTRMEKGDYPTAIAYFERALPFTPNYSLLHINLGVAYGGAGRVGEAQREFNAAIALAPTDWRSHYFYARWLRSVGRLPEAIAQLQLAVSQNPADLDSQTLLQLALREQRPSPEWYLALSLGQYQTGQFSACVASAGEALKLRPEYAEAYNNIAACHNALGEWDAGIAAAEAAVRLKPDFALAKNNLAYAMQQKQRSK
ncbi:MAG TPA: tetratricopeptide repeat protein [Vicinamibacterales bacterium]|nr:tetratricopeptide repeat protein [Vicinamibacterales bacterium]